MKPHSILVISLVTLTIWFLISSAISPSYLVEGMRNYLSLNLGSKENYVIIVSVVQALYSLVWCLILFFIGYGGWSLWRKPEN